MQYDHEYAWVESQWHAPLRATTHISCRGCATWECNQPKALHDNVSQ